jgi:putative spermidine/putrescine transport system ATP-binding protein
MSYLTITGLCVAYPKPRKGAAGNAVNDLSLSVPQGQLISLLGPSGCGKTTTMRAIAGLLNAAAGRIELAGQDITRLAAHQRDIGLVFQSYALFPHLSLFENVAFGLRLRKVGEAALKQRTLQALASVGLADFADRLPAQLSGGQQQRVALARALVIRPRLLLLDEPLSNLDARLRVEMRAELRRLQRESGITMLYVTHDQDEALSLSDRIVVMREGRIEQDDVPAVVYHQPATPFVATFMGYENLFERAQLPLLNIPHAMALPAAVTHVAWRAQSVAVRAAGQPGLPGTVQSRSYAGDRLEFWVQTTVGPVRGVAPADAAPWQEGATVAVHFDTERAALIGGAKSTR